MTGSEILKQYAYKLAKLESDYKDCFIMMWCKANPDKNIEDYAFCCRTHYIDGEAFQTFCMRKVRDIYEHTK